MKRSWPLIGLLCFLSTTLSFQPVWAGEAKDGLQALVLIPGLAFLFLYPMGLALHFLIAAYAPRRALTLVHRVEAHRGKTLILGVVNTFSLFVVVAFCHKRAEVLATLALAVWFMLAFVGSHGLARSVGARVLGYGPGEHPAPPGDLKALALGWFVILCASIFPLPLGVFFGSYWALRGTGGVVLTLFSVPDAPQPAQEPSDP